MKKTKISRRRFVATTAAASATMIAAPFVRTANAAGKLSIGFWDHWVPGANKTSEALVQEWAAKEKVEVQIDYITSQGFKNLLTIAAEAQAKSGHDILAMPTWWPQDQALNLEPVNDIMEPLIKQNGAVNGTVEYLGKNKETWLAVPATIGSQIKGPCSRIDLMKQHAGIDVQALYPAGSPPKAESWNTDTYLKRPRLATRRASRSGSASARPPTRSTPRVHSFSRLAPSWSTSRATSRSRAMRSGRRSTTASAWLRSTRRTLRHGTTPPITSGWSQERAL